jgi:hypothetical protein
MGNKKLIILFIPILCFITALFLKGEQVYQIKAPEYSIKATKIGAHKISMEGYFSYAVPGYPDLPSKIFRIAVPPDTELNSINVSYQKRGRASLGSFNIPELPPMETWVDGQKIIGNKADIYSNDSYYPESTVEYLSVSQMRKWKIVNIKYTPFQYNPVTKDLILVPEVAVSIKYKKVGCRYFRPSWTLCAIL